MLPSAPSDMPTVTLAADTIPQVIGNITDLVTGFLASAATLALTIGGARHLMSAGDPGEVSAAKRLYKEAALGYAIAVLAPTLVTLLRKALGA